MGCAGSSDVDRKAVAERLVSLEKTILAKYLSMDQLASLAEQFTTEVLGENRVVFTQNDPTKTNEALYIVCEGAVQLEVFHQANPTFKERNEDAEDGAEFKLVPRRNISQFPGPSSSKTVLTVRRVGEFFGARALTGENNNYQATTMGKTTCLKLTQAKWAAWAAKNANLQSRVLRCLNIGLEDALKTLLFLNQIDLPKLQLLAACFRFVIIDKDTNLCKREELGKEGNPLHYMLEGEVKVAQLEDGVEKVVAIVRKGSFFGEVGLVVHLPRLSTVTARKKSLFLELTQVDFRNWSLIAPESLDAFREKLEEYNIPLRYLIHNPVLQEYLLQYMKEEKSAENLQFWIPVKDFRLSQNKDPDTIRAEAQEIIELYIKEGGDKQVNINGATRKDILQALKGPVSRDVFQKAEEEVLALMTRDTWARFKGKKLFDSCLGKMTSTANYKPSDIPQRPVKEKPVIVDPGF